MPKKSQKENVDLTITNFDHDDEQCKYINKSKFLPQQCFRWLIVGASGSGKTVLALNAISKMLVFDKLFIIAKHPEQGKLKKLVDAINEAGRSQDLFLGETVDDIPEFETFQKNKQNLILLDDLVLEDQTRIADLMVRGRHRSISIIYLTQSYYRVPRIIRLQCTDYSLFEMNKKEQNLVYQDIGSACQSLNLFKSYMLNATTTDYSFLQVDIRTRCKEMKFRHGFNKNIITGVIMK